MGAAFGFASGPYYVTDIQPWQLRNVKGVSKTVIYHFDTNTLLGPPTSGTEAFPAGIPLFQVDTESTEWEEYMAAQSGFYTGYAPSFINSAFYTYELLFFWVFHDKGFVINDVANTDDGLFVPLENWSDGEDPLRDFASMMHYTVPDKLLFDGKDPADTDDAMVVGFLRDYLNDGAWQAAKVVGMDFESTDVPIAPASGSPMFVAGTHPLRLYTYVDPAMPSSALPEEEREDFERDAEDMVYVNVHFIAFRRGGVYAGMVHGDIVKFTYNTVGDVTYVAGLAPARYGEAGSFQLGLMHAVPIQVTEYGAVGASIANLIQWNLNGYPVHPHISAISEDLQVEAGTAPLYTAGRDKGEVGWRLPLFVVLGLVLVLFAVALAFFMLNSGEAEGPPPSWQQPLFPRFTAAGR